jgi:hypothetical protein
MRGHVRWRSTIAFYSVRTGLWPVTQKYESQFSYLASGDRDIPKIFVHNFVGKRQENSKLHVPESTHCKKKVRIVQTAEIVLGLNTPMSPYAQSCQQEQFVRTPRRAQPCKPKFRFLGRFSATSWHSGGFRTQPQWPVTCTKIFVFLKPCDAWRTNWIKCYSRPVFGLPPSNALDGGKDQIKPMGFKNYMAKPSSFPGSQPHASINRKMDRKFLEAGALFFWHRLPSSGCTEDFQFGSGSGNSWARTRSESDPA